MKLSILGPVTPYRGGIAHFTTLLAIKLLEAGHEVQVISFKKQYPAWLYPGESDKDYSEGREKVKAEYLLTPLNPLSWIKTTRAISDFEPEQVIIPWWVTFWGPAFRFVIRRLKKRGIRVAILIHNTLPHEARPWDRILARFTLKEADRFIVMTEKEKGRLLNLLPDSENIHIAALPIYNVFKKSAGGKQESRQQLGLPKDKPIILFFGFIRPYKGLRVLIEALKILKDQNSQAHLLIVGEFWEDKTSYLSQIKSYDLSERIHIYDSYIPDDELSSYFIAADVFAAPYTDGTQSAALKTALGFGLPIVVTEIIVDKMIEQLPNQCKIVPSRDPGSLAVGILEQLQVSVLNKDQIQDIVNQTWQEMINAICSNNLV